MILSKKHRFLFVKGAKVAGTSVEVLLSHLCGSEDIITPITPIDEKRRMAEGAKGAQNYGADDKAVEQNLARLRNTPIEQLGSEWPPDGTYYNHMPFTDIEKKSGEISADWIVFAVERDPYRKVLSLANHLLAFKSYQEGKALVSEPRQMRRCLDEMFETNSLLAVKNIAKYTDASGNLRAEILHYERLDEEIGLVLSRMQIAYPPPLQHYKVGLSSNQLNLPDYFSSAQLHRINELFAEEFCLFGYAMVQ